MASKSAYSDQEKGAEIEEQLDDLDKRVDRLRVMYEQYFMGIQKQPPSYLHTECERKIRDLTQLQIRNTGLRYRFATITQKFGAYNTYWRRTLREIEAGRYVRDLNRIKRKAMAAGDDIPQEILAAMPQRMREMVERDRVAAKAAGVRRGVVADDSDEAAIVHAPSPPKKQTYTLDMNDDLDVDQMFDDITGAGQQVPSPPDIAQPVPRAPVLPAVPRVTAPISKRSEPNDTIPTPMSFAPAGDDEPTRLRKQGDTAAPPLAAATTTAPVQGPKPPAQVKPPPVPKMTQAMPSGVRPPAPRPAARVAPIEPPPGMSEDDTRALYNKFLKARTLVGEKNDDMTYDKLLRTLRMQGSKIMEQYKAKGVEFGVVIKDNKVILKAKPKV